MTLQHSGGLTRQHNFLARVVSKNGTAVTVRRWEDPDTAETLGPFLCEGGVSGFVQVGDSVVVDRSAGPPIVKMPIEESERFAPNVVGLDPATRATSAPTEWEALLEVDGLEIPAGIPFRVEWHTEVVTVGQAGATAKQNRLLFNGSVAVDINIGAASAQAWVPWQVSTYATGLSSPARSAQLMTATSPTVIGIPLDTITSIRVLARSQDTGEGNDIVRCAELAVSL